MKLTTKVMIFFICLLLFLAVISSVYFWYQANYKPVLTKTEYITVEKIKEVEKIKRVEVPVEKIVTVEKEVIVQKLELPDWIKENENKQVLATAVVPSYEGKTNVVAIIDTKSGVGEIVAKQEPFSFIGFINDKERYGKIGYTAHQSLQITVGGQWKFLRVGEIKIGGFVEAKADFSKDSFESDNLNAVAGVVFSF